MRKFYLLPITMGLFDGGAAAGGAPAGGAAPAAGEGTQGEAQGAGRGAASRGRTGESSTANIRYGKQTDGAEPTGDQVQQNAAGSADSEEALHNEFLQLVNGKYKNAYTAETQKIIDKRFAGAKQTEQALEAQRPVLNVLMERYGIKDGDMQKLYDAVLNDDPTLEQRAEDNGMSVEQQRYVDGMQRELTRLRKAEEERVNAARADEFANRVARESAAMLQSGKYPSFNLQQEALNPEFVRLVRSGVPVEHAYKVLHMDEITSAIETQTAASTEKRVVDNIRAQGMRPRENGTSSQGSFTTKSDPRTLTKEDHKAIRERVRRGERIVF